ncbi:MULTISPECIES: hypothetical protein [Micromonospora]|uniref:Uncharacterized protein n=1 Tax=Micromonospora yangpuensis TaxID=683228 RepID=A0A1C6V2T6_9ACTN|nr:hypothetical protein [Micromonospora yangpuensis]GGM14648.1 hypothetical protein GCM10012279_35950 [Micromonospora yangpuensis]SCL60653.1 hypothetical protein GA0070617_4441 [Micromonospora yangpuensis]
MHTSTRTRNLLGGLLLAVVTLAVWAAWLGWETGYTEDPRTGEVSGPYAGWQVVGCVVTLVVVGAVAGWLLKPWVVVPVMTVVFTAAWTVDAAANDDSGLFAVGAIMVLIGMALASSLVAGTAHLARRQRAPRGRDAA